MQQVVIQYCPEFRDKFQTAISNCPESAKIPEIQGSLEFDLRKEGGLLFSGEKGHQQDPWRKSELQRDDREVAIGGEDYKDPR